MNNEIFRFGKDTKKARDKEIFGEMAEWSKARAWRARKRQKRFMGSNPILSARPKGLKINKVKII